MTTDLHETTQALITDIEKKDRRFRVAQSVFMAALLVGMALAIAIGYEALQNNQRNVATLEANNGGKLQDLQNHIDCLFTLAETPNHSTTQIADLKGCKLKPSSETKQSAQQLPQGESQPLTIGVGNGQPSQPLAVAPQQTPATLAQPGNTQQGQQTQQNVPEPAPHPLICTLTLKLLGCK